MSIFNPTNDVLDADRRVLRALRAEVEHLQTWQADAAQRLDELAASTRRIASVIDGLIGRGDGADR